VLLIAALVGLTFLVVLPEAIEADRALPHSMVGNRRAPSAAMHTLVIGAVVLLFGVPLEIGLRMRRRVLARGRAAWRGVLAVAFSTATGFAVAWWPARRWLTEHTVASAVADRRAPVAPEDLPAYEAWAGEIAGAYIGKALIVDAAVWVLLRIMLAVVEHRRRSAADG
jgi:hypothetical protein